MYFPVSGIELNPFIPAGTAFIISFFTAMGGVSGAFLLLPFQFSVLGFTSPSVSSTNQVFNIVAIPGGVYRYIREKRMLWPLAFAIITGTLPGVMIGAWIRIEYLPDPARFKVFAGLLLSYVGARLLLDIIGVRLKGKTERTGRATPKSGHEIQLIESNVRIVRFEYAGEHYQFKPNLVYGLTFFVGIVGGIYGVGGGAIIAPFFVAIVGLPVHAVAGAALLGTLTTSVAGVLFYQLLASFYPEMAVAPDWMLGFLFGAGGFAGIYLGARVQRFIPERTIKAILCFCILFISIRYIIDFFIH